jgi:hypothetical protein
VSKIVQFFSKKNCVKICSSKKINLEHNKDHSRIPKMAETIAAIRQQIRFSYEECMSIIDAIERKEVPMDRLYEYMKPFEKTYFRDKDDGVLTSDQECNIFEKIHGLMTYEQLVDFYNRTGNYIFSEIQSNRRFN